MSRLRACWVTQAPGGVGGDAGEVHAATVVLDHEQDVEAAQEDGVDVGEVDGEDRVSLGGQELAPARSGPLGCGVDARGLQDLPYGGGGHLVAEAGQLAVYASVALSGARTGPWAVTRGFRPRVHTR